MKITFKKIAGFVIITFLIFVLMWATAQGRGWKETLIGFTAIAVFILLVILAVHCFKTD